MACVPIPICIQCGTTDNPCRCKIVGPTLAFIGFVVAAVIEWPIGALVCCSHKTGDRLFAHPATVVQPSINNCIPF
jgi:hypothetical protein